MDRDRLVRNVARSALLIWIAVNVVSTWLFLARSDPWDTSDSAYYFARADEIATKGRWLEESVVASHLTRYPEVEHAAFDHWQPGTSLIVGVVGRVLGDTETAARLVIFAIGSLVLPGLLGLYVWICGGSRLGALLAAALVLSVRRLDDFRTVVDSVVPAAAWLAVAGVCWVGGVMRPPRIVPGVAASAGIGLGLLAATRGDGFPVGLLLIGAMTLLAPGGRRRRTAGWLLVGFFLTLLPLFCRNVVQLGQLFPPGASRAPWLTSYSQWGAFLAAETPAVTALIAARASAVVRAFEAFARAPEIILPSAAILVALVSGIARPKDGGQREVGGGTVFPLLAFGAFCAVGVLLAPALTLWRHRSPIPYLPFLLAGGILAADWLVRQARSRGARGTGAVLLAIAAIAVLTSPPHRLARDPGRRVPARYANAARALPDASIVMTDAPLALYVEHRAGVVRLPNDGAAAVAEAIRHYRVDYLVLFDEPVGARGVELPGVHLTPVERTADYTIWSTGRMLQDSDSGS